MADEKKPSPAGGPSELSYVVAFFIILFVLWVLSGGPERNPESRRNQFMNPIGINDGDGSTYRDNPLGRPGSITNTVPFLK